MGKALSTDDTQGLMIPETEYPYWMLQALAIQNGKEGISYGGDSTYFGGAAVADTLNSGNRFRQIATSYPKAKLRWCGIRPAT